MEQSRPEAGIPKTGNPETAEISNQATTDAGATGQSTAASRPQSFNSEPSMVEREKKAVTERSENTAARGHVDTSIGSPVDASSRPRTGATFVTAAASATGNRSAETASPHDVTGLQDSADTARKDAINRDFASGAEASALRFAASATTPLGSSNGSAASYGTTGQSTVYQIAEASRGASDGTLEIQLAPEELGRVRISFASQETGIAVSIQAERPETVELIRRHVHDLIRELRAQGLEPTSVDVGSSRSENFHGSERSMSGHSVPDGEPVSLSETHQTPDQPQRRIQASEGLDLRL
ncbi:flagellar hook-length control protein FliK [Tropicimonas sediminicola]|nr:flagellar hook-length control protein FliK [Tropicimonas sediminicola]